jgi:protein-disulfide isomerase
MKYVVHPFHLGRPEMALAAEAAWCAADQDKFFEYEHALYENQGTAWNQSNLNDLAGNVGLNRETFTQCLSSGRHRTDVENARQAAMNQGISSTPTFFINNRRVEGNQPYETFQQIIEQELANAP